MKSILTIVTAGSVPNCTLSKDRWSVQKAFCKPGGSRRRLNIRAAVKRSSVRTMLRAERYFGLSWCALRKATLSRAISSDKKAAALGRATAQALCWGWEGTRQHSGQFNRPTLAEKSKLPQSRPPALAQMEWR